MTYPHSLGSGLVREEVTEDIQLGNPGGLPRGGVLDTGPEGRAVSDRRTQGAGGQGPRCSKEHWGRPQAARSSLGQQLLCSRVGSAWRRRREWGDQN